MNNTEYMNKFSEKLKSYFDIEYDKKIFDRKFNMFAKFNQRTSRYLILKKAEFYAFQNNEYIFYENIYENIDRSHILHIKNFLDENVEKIININKEHMCSILTFILCGNIDLDDDTKKAIKRFKYYKSFAFGFKGWVNVKLIFINPETNDIYTNKFGRGDVKKLLFNN
ncbi:hypothetical protein ACFIJ5_16890 [Haloimpatiens sp. FM7330]|uniref:hypothetical protein n=1 Tax=Haloimpatiens sp. FM7330 TaxID=3298610 RepID=UPI0036328F0A